MQSANCCPHHFLQFSLEVGAPRTKIFNYLQKIDWIICQQHVKIIVQDHLQNMQILILIGNIHPEVVEWRFNQIIEIAIIWGEFMALFFNGHFASTVLLVRL